MNLRYLMEYISRRLHTLIRRYSLSWELKDFFCARADLQDDNLSEFLINVLASPENEHNLITCTPCFICVNEQNIYAGIPTNQDIFLLGPVTFSAPVRIQRRYTIASLSGILNSSIPVCSFHDFIADVLLLCNLFRSGPLDEHSLLLENCISPEISHTVEADFVEHTFKNREMGKIHNPYDQELREFTSIEKGDIEELTASLSEDYPGEIGTMAKTPLRQMKNRGIVVVALASRAAIRGGILPETAYSLSDSYIQKIEECDDIPSVLHLFYTAEYHYAQLVRDYISSSKGLHKKQSNVHTEKCKNYIFSHLHGKICVKDIAENLNMNVNYLSELFHMHEGITITKYIQLEKIKLTKNLLVYSQYSYSQIASYLGYSSQSHLGKQFKQHTGMTMQQYRTEFGVKDFN